MLDPRLAFVSQVATVSIAAPSNGCHKSTESYYKMADQRRLNQLSLFSLCALPTLRSWWFEEQEPILLGDLSLSPLH